MPLQSYYNGPRAMKLFHGLLVLSLIAINVSEGAPLNTQAWKAVNVARKAYTSLKESKAIANLPSHISKAKAAAVARAKEEQLLERDLKGLKPSGRTQPTGSTQEERRVRKGPKDRHTASKDADRRLSREQAVFGTQSEVKQEPLGSTCPAQLPEMKTSNCYSLQQLYFPVLALCLLSCASGWVIRDRWTVSTSSMQDESIEEVLERLSQQHSQRDESVERGEEVTSSAAPCRRTAGLDSESPATSPAEAPRGRHSSKQADPPGAPSRKDPAKHLSQSTKTSQTPQGHTETSENSPAAVQTTSESGAEEGTGKEPQATLANEAKEDSLLSQDSAQSATPLSVPSGSRLDPKHDTASGASHSGRDNTIEHTQSPEAIMLADRVASGSQAAALPSSDLTRSIQVNAAPGWLEKADGTQPLSPLVGLGGMLDLVAVMKHLAAQSGQDTDRMNAAQRMQLQQMAIQYCQQQQTNWLHAQANSIQGDTLGLKKQEVSKRDAIRHAERLRLALQDGLTSGLWLTLGMSLFCGVKCGYLGHQLGRCPSVASLPAFGLWRPWALLDAGKLALCYVDFTREALLGCAIMLGTAYAAIKAGAFSSSAHDSPMLKLFIALGLICGFTGYQAVSRLGGNSVRWLLCWESWIGMHMAASWQLPRLQTHRDGHLPGVMGTFVYQTSLSLVFPLVMAIVPFPGCCSYFASLLGGLING